MKYTQEQLNKLPKWAQNEIKRLESDLISANNKISQIEDVEETNTFIEDGIGYKNLPKNSGIEFRVQYGKLSVRIERSTGKIYLNSTSHGRMCILPHASNCFYVDFTTK